MLAKFRGSRRARIGVAIMTSLMLVLGLVTFVTAGVGTVTVDTQSPNPVLQGDHATFAVHTSNTETSQRYFRVTGITPGTGVTGITLDATSACVTAGASAASVTLSIQLDVASTATVGADAFTVTVQDYRNAGCAGNNTTATGSGPRLWMRCLSDCPSTNSIVMK